MEEVKSPNNEVSEKISGIIRDMGVDFFMNEKSLLIIDSYESKGKLYKTIVNAIGHLTTDSLLKKSIMESFKRNTFFYSDSDILNLFIGKDLKKGNTSLLNELLENYGSDKENTNNNMKKIKFDKVIMNPPYSNNYLHIQIATKASSLADEGVLLCPSSWIMRPLKLEDSLELKKHISKVEDVSNIFDAELGGGMSLFIIDNKKEYSLYKDIPFKNFKYPYIAKEVSRIIYEEKRYPLLWDKCLKDTKKVNKDSWYVGVPRIRGHLDPVTLEPKWDYYTLCASDNKPLKGEIYNKWAYTFKFSNEEEALAFRNYLDSEIVGYLLRLIKRGHGDGNLIKNMPYPLTLEDLAKEVSKELNEPYIKILEKMKKELKK